jgi:hypothetical protein
VKTNKTKTLVTLITQDTGWRQTKQRHWQPWLHKIQGEEKQNKETGNLEYTRYRVKTNKTKTLETLITQDTVWRQTKQRHWQPSLHNIQCEEKQNKDTGNLDYTRYRVKTNKTKTLATLITQDTGWRKTKQRNWQPWIHKIQGEEKQNKDTGNLDYTRYRVKTNKTKKLATFFTQDTVWRQTKQRHWQPSLHNVQCEDKQNKDTGNLEYTRYRVKTNKTNNTGNLDYTR